MIMNRERAIKNKSEDIQAVLDMAIERITERFAPQKIVLFGSYASGQPGPFSDIDLLIITDAKGSTRKMANEIDLLLSDRIIPMDFLVMTLEQFERQKNIIGTVIRQAYREGKVIYERAA